MEKVVLAQKTDESVAAYLSGHCELVFCKEGDSEDLRRVLSDAVAVVLGTWVKFTKEFIDAAPKLKVISRTGAGVDNVDFDYARQNGILVLNTPRANRISVAEHTIAMICALSKHFNFLDKKVREGEFGTRRLYLPTDIDGKTLGMVGCGAIAAEVAKKCTLAFNMKVIGYDPHITAAPENIGLCSTLEEIFRQSDYVSLHLPLTPKTDGLVGEDLLNLMKPTAFIINTARGGIIDENALYTALKSRRIAGAGLDVFADEPLPKGSKLAELDNLLLTPHTAALTKECALRVAMCAAQGVVDYLQGKTPEFIFGK